MNQQRSADSKRLLSNISSVGIIQIANYLIPFASVPVISRIIGPARFGIINFNSSFATYFVLLIGFGFDLTATRRLVRSAQSETEKNTIFSEVLITQIWLLTLSAIIFTVCLFFVPQLKEEKTVAIFSFLITISTVLTQNWLFQAMQDLSKIAILSLISKLIFTVLVLIVIQTRNDYIWYPFILSTVAIGISIVSFVWSFKRYKLKLEKITLSRCITLLKEERTFFISMIVINLYTTTNIVILGLFQNSSEVGIYSAGQRLIAIFQSILSATLAQAIFPYVGKAFSKSFENGLRTVQKLLPLVMFATAGLSLAFLIIGPLVIQVLYGDQFKAAVIVFRILSPTPLIVAFSTMLGVQVMMNLKMDKHFLKISLSGAIFSIIINVIFAKRFGYVASAYCLLATELLIAFQFYYTLKRKNIKVFNKPDFALSSLSAAMQSVLKKRPTE